MHEIDHPSRRQFLKAGVGGTLATGAMAWTESNTAAATPGAREERIAFSAARLFDGRRVHEDHAVLVAEGKVLDVVPRDKVPEDVTHHYEPECTILPGLIDIHVHFMRWQGPQFLAYGVTTVRDTGNDMEWILERRGEWKAKPWPRIFCLGPIIDGPGPVHNFVSSGARNVSEAVAAVRRATAAGVDGLKFYVRLEPAWLPDMVAAGHEAGCKVSMHCAGGGVLSAARAGVDEFFHLDGILADVWPEHPPGWLNVWGKPGFNATYEQQQRVADSLASYGITATPTLTYWDSQRQIRRSNWRDTAALRYTPSDMIAWQTLPSDPIASDEWRRALEAAQRFTRLLLEREVPVLAGSDVPCGVVPPGLSLWRELALLVESGMTPLDAIRAGTANSADYLGRKELGCLVPGAAGDLVLVKGNPLKQLPARPEIPMTIQGGVLHRPADLLAAVEDSLEDEPWALQFKHQWEQRTGA
jgi:imidazolonepropionase-like amidohydrolase